jgi:6,7-dimethyl-8-ribityllumazine synthase
MSSIDKNLSEFQSSLPELPSKRIAVVVSEWNDQVTSALLQGCLKVLTEAKISPDNIISASVPGSFELILGSQKLASRSDIDAVICLGCVIQGETRHFDFISQAVAQGLADVGLKFDKPVIFGVLTTDNQEQALARAGGEHGNKGEEAAYTALRMLDRF